MKYLLLFLLGIGVVNAAPFVDSDATTQTITGCKVQIDTAATFDSPAVNKACHIDVSNVAVGSHSIKATFYNVDPIWGRSESVFSVPLAFTRPSAAVLSAPLNLLLVP